jgi:hypothetical protein
LYIVFNSSIFFISYGDCPLDITSLIFLFYNTPKFIISFLIELTSIILLSFNIRLLSLFHNRESTVANYVFVQQCKKITGNHPNFKNYSKVYYRYIQLTIHYGTQYICRIKYIYIPLHKNQMTVAPSNNPPACRSYKTQWTPSTVTEFFLFLDVAYEVCIQFWYYQYRVQWQKIIMNVIHYLQWRTHQWILTMIMILRKASWWTWC